MSDESLDAIRAARHAMNEAIARRDPAAIAKFFLPTYHVFTARSMQRSSKEASAASWADMFARDAAATHTATPDDIHVNDSWGMAEEHGRWNGTVGTKDGPLAISGVYAAKWHLTADGWLLQGEMFTPLEVERVG